MFLLSVPEAMIVRYAWTADIVEHDLAQERAKPALLQERKRGRENVGRGHAIEKYAWP
jgi:hypothetical protein